MTRCLMNDGADMILGRHAKTILVFCQMRTLWFCDLPYEMRAQVFFYCHMYQLCLDSVIRWWFSHHCRHKIYSPIIGKWYYCIALGRWNRFSHQSALFCNITWDIRLLLGLLVMLWSVPRSKSLSQFKANIGDVRFAPVRLDPSAWWQNRRGEKQVDVDDAGIWFKKLGNDSWSHLLVSAGEQLGFLVHATKAFL